MIRRCTRARGPGLAALAGLVLMGDLWGPLSPPTAVAHPPTAAAHPRPFRTRSRRDSPPGPFRLSGLWPLPPPCHAAFTRRVSADPTATCVKSLRHRRQGHRKSKVRAAPPMHCPPVPSPTRPLHLAVEGVIQPNGQGHRLCDDRVLWSPSAEPRPCKGEHGQAAAQARCPDMPHTTDHW